MNHKHILVLMTLMAVVVCIMDAREVLAAGGGGMPWETPIQSLVDSITGPVARAIGIVSVFIFGGMMAMSEAGGLRVVLGIVFGLSIMFAAATWGLTFFGFAGGAVI